MSTKATKWSLPTCTCSKRLKKGPHTFKDNKLWMPPGKIKFSTFKIRPSLSSNHTKARLSKRLLTLMITLKKRWPPRLRILRKSQQQWLILRVPPAGTIRDSWRKPVMISQIRVTGEMFQVTRWEDQLTMWLCIRQSSGKIRQAFMQAHTTCRKATFLKANRTHNLSID